jgi:hypothetical protein
MVDTIEIRQPDRQLGDVGSDVTAQPSTLTVTVVGGGAPGRLHYAWSDHASAAAGRRRKRQSSRECRLGD